MKHYFLFGLSLGAILLGGCGNVEQQQKIIGNQTGLQAMDKQPVISIKNTGTENKGTEKKDIVLHGNISSGINIPGNTIYISGDRLIYNNIFSINIPKKGLLQRDFFNQYSDILNITDGNLNSLQINKYVLSQNNTCDYNFEAGVKKISKSTKTINGVKINLANALFGISGPDIVNPINSWQSFLCFIDGETVYKITVSDDKSFRTDIINSFKFLK